MKISTEGKEMSVVEVLSETGGSYKYQKSERKTEDDSLLQTVIPLEQLEFFLDWRRVPAHQVTQLDDVELDAVRHVRECAVLLLLCYCNRYRRTLQRQTVNRLLATSNHLKSLCMGQCQHQKKTLSYSYPEQWLSTASLPDFSTVYGIALHSS